MATISHLHKLLTLGFLVSSVPSFQLLSHLLHCAAEEAGAIAEQVFHNQLTRIAIQGLERKRQSKCNQKTTVAAEKDIDHITMERVPFYHRLYTYLHNTKLGMHHLYINYRQHHNTNCTNVQQYQEHPFTHNLRIATKAIYT